MKQFGNGVFHALVGNHLAADLAETAGTTGNVNVTILVHVTDITGVVIVVLDDFSGQFRLTEITFHHSSGTHLKFAVLSRRQFNSGVDVHDTGMDARQRTTDTARMITLGPQSVNGVVEVDRHDRRQFSTAVTLNDVSAGHVAVTLGQFSTKFFRTGNAEPQGFEILPFGFHHILLQEGRSCRQNCDFEIPHAPDDNR